MKYLSLRHRIIRYFSKYGRNVAVVHLPYLKPSGSDYMHLVSARRDGQKPQIIATRDATFDEVKVRGLFAERFGDAPEDFDAEMAKLRVDGYIHTTRAEATDSGLAMHAAIEAHADALRVPALTLDGIRKNQSRVLAANFPD